MMIERTGAHKCVVCLGAIGWDEFNEYDYAHADCFFTEYPMQTTFDEEDKEHEWRAQ